MDNDDPSARTSGMARGAHPVGEDFALGQIRISQRRGIVVRGDVTTSISTRAMSALCILAANPGRVVPRQELESTLWPDGAVPHSGVSHLISELRHALGDDAHACQVIESVTGRGYRLLPQPHAASSGAHDAAGDAAIVAEAGTGTAHEAQAAHADDLRYFWAELRERRVFRLSVGYVIAGGAALQAASVVFPIMGWPEWLLTALLLAGLVAYPVVVLLTWVLQWGPQGLRLELSPGGAKSRRHRRAYLLMCACIGVLVVLLSVRLIERIGEQSVANGAQSGTPQPAPVIPGNSIAVLRFANLGGRPEDSYFSDGLSEELLNLLARYRDLHVASRTASWALPEGIATAQMRERLGVDYVVEGSVRRDADALRITVQLIKTADGFHLWSETYDRQLSDIFAVQDEIASKVAAALKLLLSADASSAADSQRWDLEAYDAYLLGMQQVRMPVTSASLDEAERLFMDAKRIEPTFGGAWAGLCRTYLARYGLSKSAGDFEQAEAACHRTLTLDQTSPGIFEALGALYALSGQQAKAEEAYRSALVLAPHSVDALIGLGESSARGGDTAQAEPFFRQAIDLDPGYWKTHNALGTLYFNQGRAADAIAPFRRVTLLAPEFAIGLNNLGAAYFIDGQYEKATEIFGRSLAIQPDRNAYSNAGTSLFMLRDFAGAAARYRQALELAPEDYLLWGNLGDALRYAGAAPEEARTAYERAAQLSRGLREINADDPSLNVALARYCAHLGRNEDAERLLGALAGAELDMYVHYDVALTRLALGQREVALAALHEAIASGYRADLVARDPSFDDLHGEAAFQTLVAPRTGATTQTQGAEP